MKAIRVHESGSPEVMQLEEAPALKPGPKQVLFRSAAVAGYPHITVPADFVHGLPVGIAFFGPAWSEPTLLRLTCAFEQATIIRQKPSFMPTVDCRA
jgi:Asp-tRNA(Asn)/Glu-tRNA(Gln) amidotransferase A subunit family amidase